MNNRVTRIIKNLFLYHYPIMFSRIEIDIFDLCNRKCKYCPNYKYPQTSHKMPDKLFFKIIDQLGKMKYRNEITLHRYGEPLLDNRLVKFVKYIKTNCKLAKINLFTNGDLLSYIKFKELSDAGVDRFTITQHDNVLSKNNFDIFNNATKEEREKITFRMGIEMHLINRAGLLDLGERKIKTKQCLEPIRHMEINSYGKVVLCCNDYFSQVVLGDLNKEKLMSIWKNKKYNKLRKDLFFGFRNKISICKNCDFQS